MIDYVINDENCPLTYEDVAAYRDSFGLPGIAPVFISQVHADALSKWAPQFLKHCCVYHTPDSAEVECG